MSTIPITPYLEHQADRVESLLAAHRTPGRITGGAVGPRHIFFTLEPAPHIRFASIQSLRVDLALALQVQDVALRTEKGIIYIEFPNPNPTQISLKSMLDEIGSVPFCTALLGLKADGVLTVRLSSPDNPHALISGTTGSGKSTLLQGIAASLAVNNSPRLVTFLAIDPKGRTFSPLAKLPHFTRPPIENPASAAEALHTLLKVMQLRDRDKFRPDYDGPRIVVFIDELADLIMQDATLTHTLTRLVQRGRDAGIHIVAATQHPSAAILHNLMRANFPLRLVGKVVSADDARVASGQAGTNAHLLNGRGDFVAVSGGTTIRFHVPYQKDFAAIVNSISYNPVTSFTPGKVEMREKPRPSTITTTPKQEPGERVAEAVEKLRPQWHTTRTDWHKNKWGLKTQLVRDVWGEDRRYEGSFAEWLEQAVEILETEYVSTLN